MHLRLRERRLQESEALAEGGNINESWNKKSQAVSILYEHIVGLIEVRYEFYHNNELYHNSVIIKLIS